MTDTVGALSNPNRVLEVRRSAFGVAELHDTRRRRAGTRPGPAAHRRVRDHGEQHQLRRCGRPPRLLGLLPAAHDPATWGRVPAMGWAEIVESANPDLPIGGRYYGWFPMATSVTFTATATRDGFRDDGAHRQSHAPVYRGVRRGRP